MEYAFPYLKKFKAAYYHLDKNYGDEFYISMEFNAEKRSLYCPIEAFINSDTSIITNRMETYFSSYYHDRLADKEKALSVLGFPECKELFDYIQNYEKGE